MDVVRCLCPHDSVGVKCGRHPACAIHGTHSFDPIMPYALSHMDRAMLKTMRIGTMDAAEIEAVRVAEETRFNQPRRVE